MARLRHLLTLVPSAVALVAFAPAAHAESAPAPPRCREHVRPATGTTAPANLPAIVLDQIGNSPGLTSSIVVEELTSDGAPVKLVAVTDPKVPAVTLLVPTTDDPLATGTAYSLTYAVRCSVPQPITTHETSFRAGPAVTLPTRIGEVRELDDGTAIVTPTPELRAFLQTTRFDVLVDGEPLASTRYGSVADAAEIAIDATRSAIGFGPGGPYAPGASEVLCPAGATRARHEVKLVAHVAGAEGDTAPLSFHLDVECSAPRGGGKPYLPDGGGDDRGASAGGGAGEGNASAGDGGGCSTGGGGPLGSVAAFFATGAALAVLSRRRRAAAGR